MLYTMLFAFSGAVIASYLRIPMGEVFGSMIGVLLANKVSSRLLSIPRYSLIFIQLILGLSVGNLMDVNQFSDYINWQVASGLMLCMALQVWFGYLWLSKVGRWTKSDSLLASVPGAMAAILVVLKDQETPSPRVIFAHSTRLVVLIIISGILASYLDISVAKETVEAVSVDSMTGLLLVSIIATVVGFLLTKVGLAAPYIITGLATAMLSNYWSIDLLSYTVPDQLISISSVLLGALIATNLQHIQRSEVLAYLRCGLTVTLISISVTVMMAFLYSLMVEQSFLVLLISWAPGSLETMAITALYLGLEPAFVMVNHVIRLTVLQMLPSMMGFKRS